ncbi:hypothetical protein ACFOSC_11270, partial [Streptantibioticus rubrisoli]|uniref:hypothetical protein n=1 Tax=Streptantibioticus rubrisoli TaxID=1387313 RepID=UPI00362244B1
MARRVRVRGVCLAGFGSAALAAIGDVARIRRRRVRPSRRPCCALGRPPASRRGSPWAMGWCGEA